MLASSSCSPRRHARLVVTLTHTRPRRRGTRSAPRAVDRIREPVLASPRAGATRGVPQSYPTGGPDREVPIPSGKQPPRGAGGRRTPWATSDFGRWPTRTRGSWRWSIPTGPSTPPSGCSAAPTRWCTACAASSLEPGDVVATLLPNGVEMFELYLAALQAGWYLVPINHHLIGPEVAYILKDSGAKAFIAHERFAEVAIDAATEASWPRTGCFAVGEIAGFSSYAAMRDEPTDHRSSRPDHRRRDELHLGDHRQSQGGVPQAERGHPRGGGTRVCRGSSSCSASNPTTPTSTSSARRSTTPPSCATRAPPSTSSTPWC